MTTVELMSHLRSLDVRVWAENGQLCCNGPKGVVTPELQALLVARKAEILSFLDGAAGAVRPLTSPPLLRCRRDRPLPVSFAQQRLWFIDQLEPNSSLYNISSNLRLEGPLDVAAILASLNEIVRRHETLRTTIPAVDGQPRQDIAPVLKLEMPVVDLRPCSPGQRDAEVRRLTDEEARRPFDLARGPLVRITLLQLDDRDHLVLLTMHHIVSDGWSMFVLFREFAALYSAFSKGDPSPLDELPIQYADFAHWQHEWLQGEPLNKQLLYWQRQLDGAPVLQLPVDRPRPILQSYRGAEQSFAVSRRVTETLRTVSKGEGVTLFMTLLAAFNVLLYRYTGQEDIVVGSPIAGRNRSEIEGLIGLFINTIVLRSDLSGDPTFREVLARIREMCFGAYAHQEAPFEKLVEKLQPDRNLSHHPLFQVMFILQNAPAAFPEFEGLTATPLRLDTTTAKIDLILQLREGDEGLLGSLQYSTDLFDAATIERMSWHYRTLLEGIVSRPDDRISELPLLTADERRKLLVEWNDTSVDYSRNKAIHELFEAQVERTPDATAAVFENRQLSYRDLNARANQLGRYLKSRGVGPEILVAICVKRSLDMVVGILGILKAGGAYVPLDPEYPEERLAFILKDIEAPLIVTEEQYVARLRPICSPPIGLVRLDTDWPGIALESDRNTDSGSGATNLAYVMYTSGSTGAPKGVSIEHRSVARLVRGANYVAFGDKEVLLQFAPLSFDASTLELWGSLLNGSKLVVFPPHTPSLEELGAFILKNKITTLWLTSALFLEMVESQLEQLRNVRQLLAGGDVLSVFHVHRALSSRGSGFKLINGYGPTENTTFTCCHVMESVVDVSHSVPIGRPVSNTQVYILDQRRQPVPIGVPGELYTGGDGLARGYHRRADLTAEKFFRDPFSSVPGARLYRTGDLVRYLKDGSIEFLGRVDDQVKVRGFRIEPGEIEVVLGRHPSVGTAVVVARDDTRESKGLADKRLVAYIVSRHDPARSSVPRIDELRAFVKETLPEYMIPSDFVFLDSLPMTANGKVDRRRLPAPDRTRSNSGKHFVGARNHVERQLVEIWERVLGVPNIGVKDSFFDLGGHSLLAVRVTSQIEKTFGRKLPLASFFQAPTVEQLARLLTDEVPMTAWSSLMPIQTAGARTPFFWVHGEASNAFLSGYLNPDQPLYGVAHQSEDGRPARYTSVEDISAHYLSEVRAVQPRGPYFLGGYCFGGMVAFEMAQQLKRQNEDVGILVLLAPSSPRYTLISRPVLKKAGKYSPGQPMRDEVSRHLHSLKPLAFSERLAYVLARVKDKTMEGVMPIVQPVWKLAQRAACMVYTSLGFALPLSLRNPYILGVYRRAMRQYGPPRYDGAVVLFLPDSHDDNSAIVWRELSTERLDLFEFTGQHTDILREPRVGVWAAQLSALLDAAQAATGSPGATSRCSVR